MCGVLLGVGGDAVQMLGDSVLCLDCIRRDLYVLVHHADILDILYPYS